MIPSKPVRKSANIGVRPNGVVPGVNKVVPTPRSAKPFGSVSKSVYRRTSVGVSPRSVTVNDNDAGNGTGNVRNVARKNVPMKFAD